MRDFAYVTPTDLRGAAALLRRHGEKAALKSGGIDLVDLMKEGIAAPETIVNLLPLSGLATIREDGAKGLSIGPLATLEALATDANVVKTYPLLARAAGDAATPQLRHVATLAGNLCQRPRCWYFRSADFPCLKKGGDLCYAVEGDNRYHAIFGEGPCHIVSPSSTGLALVALDGEIKALSEKGEREIGAESFFSMPAEDVTREISLHPGEIVSGVRVPAPAPRSASAYVKVREKQAFDWPVAEAAVVVVKGAAGEVRSARIVLGAAAPVPWRARVAEETLVGRPISEKTAAAAASAALEGARPMSGNAYKVVLLREVVRRAILKAA